MIRLKWIAVAVLVLPGCNLTGFEDSHRLSSEEIQSLIDDAPFPEYTPDSETVPPGKITVGPDGKRTVEINLVEAIRLSLANNQGWLTQTETLDLQLLSLETLRRSWWPVQSPLTATVNYVDTKDADPAYAQTLGVGVNQKLPWGGSVNLSANQTGAQGPGNNFYAASASAGVTFPLFRGGGWRIAVESQVSAERGYVYSLRNFEYARTELMIQTVQSYFGLLQQELTEENLKKSLEHSKRGVEIATLQFGRGKVSRTDVFSAELAVTNAEDQLANTREEARTALDNFKIDLGLRTEDGLVLTKEDIDFKTFTILLDDAINEVLATNPEWLNARDQFDDAGRALAIASNANLPQVDLGANYTWAQVASTRPLEDLDTATRGVGLSLGFSLDLERSELNRAYQAAIISYRQAQRSFARARDRIARQAQQLLTELKQAEVRMTVQERARKDARSKLELAEDEYERGLKDNLYVIQARDQLVSAANAYEAQLVTAKVTQLRLLHYIGRLKPDDEGRWLR
jgi:outer membrane protein TolC